MLGRTLLWGDDFDAPAGAPPDPCVWSYELGGGGWGNAELQRYTDARENAAHDGRGNLVISARRERSGYTSARLVTKAKLQLHYGRIEARARVPRGRGLWTAIWALGTDIDAVGWPECGEIDVMEQLGREPRRLFGTLHGPGYCGHSGVSTSCELLAAVADDFHVFAVEWAPDRIDWSVDGLTYHSADATDVPGPWVFDHPFYLLVNLAVGGDLGGPVEAGTRFPQALTLDYVRAYAPLTDA